MASLGGDTFEARLRFGRFIGMMSGEENTYFLRAFEGLGVTEDRRASDPDTQPTIGFKAIMREAAETRRKPSPVFFTTRPLCSRSSD
jgi:thiaminase/transcriptional activator TenA